MAKGSQAKIDVGNQIINLFGENAFWNGEGKEIRINTSENGESLQVKIAFTVAKVAVEPGAADAIPGAKTEKNNSLVFPEPVAGEKIEISEEEKNAVADLMKELGL